MTASERSGSEAGWSRSRLSVNISMLFRELPMLERPAAAKAAGFDAIEVWWPFPGEPDPPRRRVSEFVIAVAQAEIDVVSLNLDTGDVGERGLMCRPDRVERLRRNVPVTIEMAKRLGCTRLNALYGNIDPERPHSEYRRAGVEAYRYAGRAAASIGAQVVIEPINSPNAPGYGVRTIHDALELRNEVGAVDMAPIGLLLDVYRLDQDQDAIEDSIVEAGAALSHVQVADAPGRSEPGSGSLDFQGIIRRLHEVNYEGYIGLEYVPSSTTLASLETTVPHLTG